MPVSRLPFPPDAPHQAGESELAFVALEIEKYEAGEAKKRQAGGQGGVLLMALMPEAKGVAREKAAAAVGVSPRYVQDAKKVEAAAPELAAQVQLRAIDEKRGDHVTRLRN